MSKPSTVLKVTQVALNFAVAILAVAVIGAILTAIFNPHLVREGQFISIIVTLTGGIMLLKIFYDLKQVINSVAKQEPFINENVSRFRVIGILVMSVGVLQAIINFPHRQSGGIDLFSVPSGSVGPEILSFLLLGCLALVLSEIFAEAIKIKNENDMTI